MGLTSYVCHSIMNLESVGQSNKWITNEEVYIQTLLASSPLTLFGGFLVSALDYYIYVRYLWGMNLFRLIIYVFGGLLVTGSIYALFVYSPSQPLQETQLALVSDPIALTNEPTNTECEVVECPTFVCEPEIIIKEVPVEKVVIKTEYIEVPVEKIVEVPVDRIVYQDKVVYQDRIIYKEISQECPPTSSSTETVEESVAPVSIILQPLSDNRFSFTNFTDSVIKINHLKFVVSGNEKDEIATVNLSINFPDSADSGTVYGFDSVFLTNYTGVVSISCEPNFDGIYPSGCLRSGLDIPKNQIRSGETALFRVSFGTSGSLSAGPKPIEVQYVSGSITDVLTDKDIQFSSILF